MKESAQISFIYGQSCEAKLFTLRELPRNPLFNEHADEKSLP